MRADGAPERIMVMGPPGSGKSTLARRLGSKRGLPVFHLDALHHAAGWIPRPAADFHADLAHAAGLPGWVIDGNYVSAIADRLARADLIIVLALPRRITLSRIVRRVITHHGTVRPDSAPGCPERIDLAFLAYAWTWRRRVRPKVMAALAGCEDRMVTLRTDAEIDALVARL